MHQIDPRVPRGKKEGDTLFKKIGDTTVVVRNIRRRQPRKNGIGARSKVVTLLMSVAEYEAEKLTRNASRR